MTRGGDFDDLDDFFARPKAPRSVATLDAPRSRTTQPARARAKEPKQAKAPKRAKATRATLDRMLSDRVSRNRHGIRSTLAAVKRAAEASAHPAAD